MSADIQQFVVHQLAFDQQEQLVVVPRSTCFDITPQIELLAQQINHAFNTKPSKGVGGFSVSASKATQGAQIDNASPEEDAEFVDFLQQMRAGECSFIEFSLKGCKRLQMTMQDMGIAESGFVVFCQYEYLATEYLMVALVNTKSHVEITKSLDLSYSDHLDLAKMQLAVRIDLTQLDVQPQHNRYISFIKGRMGRKVSDFFMQFINCEEQVDTKQQNKELVNQVDQYLASNALEPAERSDGRAQVSEYYKQKLEQGDDIDIRELSQKLPPSDHSEDFFNFTRQTENPIEEVFQADRGVIKRLEKYSGQGGGVSISFDRALYGDKITYHRDTDTLVIKGLPPNLKDQLTKLSS